MSTSGRTNRVSALARLIVVVVLGAWLLWQIFTVSFAAVAARSTDARLLTAFGTPTHPQAGAALAQARLVGKDHQTARQLAHAVIMADPTNDRALRVLGLATEAGGDREQALAIMQQAGRLGWRDTPTQQWLLQRAILTDDFTGVVQHADALARRNRGGEMVRGLFLAAVAEPRLRGALADRLAQQPMWRGAFFADVRQRLPEALAEPMAGLFKDLQDRRSAIAPTEWMSYIDRLAELGQFARARRTWATAFGVPTQQLAGIPYDPAFRAASARAPDAPTSQFEWSLNANLEGTVTFGDDEGRPGLTIPTGVSGGAALASQTIMLAPGTHELTARIDGSPETAAAGWTLTCLPAQVALPRRLKRGSNDELSSVIFEVPAANCAAQRLALVARDQFDAQPATVRSVTIR